MSTVPLVEIPEPDHLSRARDAWLLPVLREVLSEDQLRELHEENVERLWSVVVARGWISDDALLRAAAGALRLHVADLAAISVHALSLVAERWARRFQVLPLGATETRIVVATADPCDVECERTLAFATGRSIEFVLASPVALGNAIDRAYRGEATSVSPERLVDVQHLSGDAESAPPSASDDSPASITRLVDEILGAGISSRASDIHIEAEEQGIAVRHRVDGVLDVVRRLPRALGPALVSRIKIISGLDIADRLRPQDGRARIAVNGVAVDLRVSTLPASHGEKVVIRVLDSRAAVMTLDRMGFNPDELSRIERLLEAREGLILVTGPTGSGKTTTLYAALRQLKQRGVNIVTVEDPIEYRLPGIVQVQVRERAGLTFAAALRSIMRQDPDVLLIGEIRDRETAEIAIQASLTGHLVLSTLHTNDAPSAVTRLIDIGVASYKIATAVKGVLAQRLMRRLCDVCQNQSLASGGACPSCGGSGFRGRLAVVEVLIASPDFERRVAAGESTERIAAAGRAGGMKSLWLSGLDHVARGETTIGELQRVASPDEAALDSATVTEYQSRTQSRATRRATSRADFVAEPSVATLEIGTVDVYVIRPRSDGWKVLALQRSMDTRCPGAWESVHGHLEPGEEPEQAAVREVREETGLDVARLYNVTVQPFYLHTTHTVMVAVVFAAFVEEPGTVTTGPEHQRHEWLDVDDALRRFHWPRERAALTEIRDLLSSGDAGPVEDVLRVPLA